MKLSKLFIMLVIMMSQSLFAVKLYPGETIYYAAGYPSLIKLSLASKAKPLIVLIPGDANLARIFYGFPGASKKDFLEYWLNKNGYSTLSISYPTDNEVFNDKVYPLFNINDWANQSLLITKDTIEKYHLSNKVILLVWSMGGIITAKYNEIAKKNNIDVIAVSLSATPPIPNLIPNQEKTIKFSTDNLADRVTLRKDRFLKFLDQENAINGRIIIPRATYISDFLGNPPVSLLNTPYTAERDKIKYNEMIEQQDSNGLSFSDYPLVGIITGDDESDLQHVIGDKYTWMFLNQQSIYNNYYNNIDLFRLSQIKKGYVINKINALELAMTCTVKGGHFFFVGQYGAKRTALCIENVYKNTDILQIYLKSSR